MTLSEVQLKCGPHINCIAMEHGLFSYHVIRTASVDSDLDNICQVDVSVEYRDAVENLLNDFIMIYKIRSVGWPVKNTAF